MRIDKLEHLLLNQPCYKIGEYFLSVLSIKRLAQDREIAKNHNILNSWYVSKGEELGVEKQYIANLLWRHKGILSMSKKDMIDKVVFTLQGHSKLPNAELNKVRPLCREYIEKTTSIEFDTEKESYKERAKFNALTGRWI